METSYFAASSRLPNAVAISRGVPRGWRGRRYLKLAPPWDLVHEKDPARYRERYQSEVLSKLTPEEVVLQVGEEAVLLCWEKDATHCHRRLVASWLEENLGINVPERDTDAGGGRDCFGSPMNLVWRQ